tara:strand:+ start:5037 stop:5546 length:510 start_codon:yes stop_codon:yes gene_type:complete
MTVTYQKTSNHNTNYYRRNKLEKFNVHTCPHCNYETTGPKSSLQAHIWSKHTPENLKPFQCPCFKCTRGFASRANLHKHILKKHNTKIPKRRKDIFVYKISLQNQNNEEISNDKNKFYSNNKFIIPDNLPIVLSRDEKIMYDDLQYDKDKGIISLEAFTRDEVLEKIGN